LVVALIGVYLLNPIVTRMERRGVPRILGTLITYLIAGGILATVLTFTIPVVADQIRSFARSAPEIIDRAAGGLRDLAERFDLPVTGDAATPTGEGVIDFFGRLLSFTRGLFDLAIVFILGPILAFYFLVDAPKIKRGIRALIPSNRRAEAEALFQRIGKAIGGFFRGQLLVSLFVGVSSAIALFIVGLPFWAVVGLVAGITNLIPLIGPFIGGIVAIIIAFTTGESGGGLLSLEPGWPLAVGSAVALLIVQQIDNHIMSPNIVARTVQLHPVTVMLGLLAGGTLLGLWGMLLAVPTLATVKILLLHAWDTRMQWPPPGPEGVAARVRTAATDAGAEPPPPSERVEQARRPVRATERRGSWWSNAIRAVFGSPKRRETPEETEAREANTVPGPAGPISPGSP
ncbi:MAG TPA: AI-2E family transporter, partial [Actinomycetota bacterium]|nr:AI-2E family transporter [Actinomycetota bacterium]